MMQLNLSSAARKKLSAVRTQHLRPLFSLHNELLKLSNSAADPVPYYASPSAPSADRPSWRPADQPYATSTGMTPEMQAATSRFDQNLSNLQTAEQRVADRGSRYAGNVAPDYGTLSPQAASAIAQRSYRAGGFAGTGRERTAAREDAIEQAMRARQAAAPAASRQARPPGTPQTQAEITTRLGEAGQLRAPGEWNPAWEAAKIQRERRLANQQYMPASSGQGGTYWQRKRQADEARRAANRQAPISESAAAPPVTPPTPPPAAPPVAAPPPPAAPPAVPPVAVPPPAAPTPPAAPITGMGIDGERFRDRIQAEKFRAQRDAANASPGAAATPPRRSSAPAPAPAPAPATVPAQAPAPAATVLPNGRQSVVPPAPVPGARRSAAMPSPTPLMPEMKNPETLPGGYYNPENSSWLGLLGRRIAARAQRSWYDVAGGNNPEFRRYNRALYDVPLIPLLGSYESQDEAARKRRSQLNPEKFLNPAIGGQYDTQLDANRRLTEAAKKFQEEQQAVLGSVPPHLREQYEQQRAPQKTPFTPNWQNQYSPRYR